MNKAPKSEIEQIQFYKQCLQKFTMALAGTQKVELFYNIAGTTLCLRFAGPALLPYLTPAFEHLKIEPVSKPDFTINAWDTISTGVNAPPPPCEWADFSDRGDIYGFNSKRIKTAFHWSEYSVNVMDLNTNTGVYWVKNPKAFPYWVYSSPFRSMIQWWMEKNGCQLLHAAAVGTEKGAVLITGKGGTGKSTSALICLNNGMKYLGDDYVIIKSDPEPKVYSLYSTAKLMLEDMDRFPALKPFAGKRLKEFQEKEVLFLYPGLKNQIVNEMPLRAILTPQIQKEENTFIEPTSFWPIQRAMSFTTMSQLPGVGSHTQKYIGDFISKLPCYLLKPGSNFDKIPETITDFIQDPEKYSSTETASVEAIEMPLISIIIPIHNGAKFIKKAIQNILHQNYPAIEILVVDDGSTDNTREVVENLPIDVRYFHQPNSGPASARNRAIRDVSGDYIAFLDVDDLWPEKNLGMLMNELIQNPDLDLVRGYAQLFRLDDEGNSEYIGNPSESFPNYIGAGLYRKSAFDKVGLYDPDLRFGEDGDWFNRARELNINMKRLDEVTLLVQRHEANMTKGKNLIELNTLKVFKKKLERKRSSIAENVKPESKKPASDHPKISVIIPVHNGATFITETINSVFSQNYEPIEVLVVDDGSSDNLNEIIQMTGKDIIYIKQDNMGPAAARNKGIELATGKYLAFIDCDDLWTPNKLQLQMELMHKNASIDIVLGATLQTPITQKIDPENQTSDQTGMFKMSLGAALFKKSVFGKVGALDNDLHFGEDLDWFFRARESRVFILIHKEIVQYYRQHAKMISNDNPTVNKNLLRIQKKSIVRRRKAGMKAILKFPKLDNFDEVIKFWQSKD